MADESVTLENLKKAMEDSAAAAQGGVRCQLKLMPPLLLPTPTRPRWKCQPTRPQSMCRNWMSKADPTPPENGRMPSLGSGLSRALAVSP